jgi:hypothetical protein
MERTNREGSTAAGQITQYEIQIEEIKREKTKLEYELDTLLDNPFFKKE